jgi:hypothetical protein
MQYILSLDLARSVSAIPDVTLQLLKSSCLSIQGHLSLDVLYSGFYYIFLTRSTLSVIDRDPYNASHATLFILIGLFSAPYKLAS